MPIPPYGAPGYEIRDQAADAFAQDTDDWATKAADRIESEICSKPRHPPNKERIAAIITTHAEPLLKMAYIGDHYFPDLTWKARAEELNKALRATEKLVARLETAIREHRDACGDDRCWMDDEELYKVLPEGYTPPTRDTTVELDLCRKFIASRQHPATVYVSPQRHIEELTALLRESKREHQHAGLIGCPAYIDDTLVCHCGADTWNARVNAIIGVK